MIYVYCLTNFVFHFILHLEEVIVHNITYVFACARACNMIRDDGIRMIIIRN